MKLEPVELEHGYVRYKEKDYCIDCLLNDIYYAKNFIKKGMWLIDHIDNCFDDVSGEDLWEDEVNYWKEDIEEWFGKL